ncbi:hypothetical protein ECC02_003204 [Trypanosoma cruzi]|uniref:RING-type domain-containing protein n=2 Tax=Trypanosoma cruzi TaxID=5693 RepID=A0A7J6YBT0_TRYCR|nr:hypothetical protein ECC02_003204 [Trypanosoma cruzi]
MAGLTSDNISIASARQYGFSRERDLCVYCGKNSKPPPTDPFAPVFVFFSLVDCRHYVCQPCALVNCDNAGRYIRCPTCHSISRLAQTGKKRTGPDELRVTIDDGVSSAASHASRRSVRVPADNVPARSALAKADRSKKRSASVQFSANPTTSVVPPPEESENKKRGDASVTSPLTRDAVGNLPKDPSYRQRERMKEVVTRSKSRETVAVNLYTIKSSSVTRRRSSGSRASSVPLPPTEHRYLAPPIPFAPPPPLRIRTVEEEEEEVREKEVQQDVHVSLSAIAAEIEESLLAAVAKEAQERSTISMAEEYRRNAMSKQREIREKDMLAAQVDITSVLDLGVSPRTPLDVSEGQVSATSDDETPASLLKRHPVAPLLYDEEEKQPVSVTASDTTVQPEGTQTTEVVLQKLEDTESSIAHEKLEPKEEIEELKQRDTQRLQHQLESLQSEVISAMEMSFGIGEIEVRERQIIEGVEGMERRLLHSSRVQAEVEISAFEAQRLSANRTAQAATNYIAYISKEFDEYASSEKEHRTFIEEMQRSDWSTLERDFHASLKRFFEVELLRLTEKHQMELTRASITLTTEETKARMWLEQNALDDLTRLHMNSIEALAECRRQLQMKEMQRGVSRIVAVQQLYMQHLYDLAVEEDNKRWKILEEEQRDRHAEWTSFITTVPTLRTATASPSSVTSASVRGALSSSHAPESSRTAATASLSVASQYFAALVEEAELEALQLQHMERHERHALINLFLAQSQRLKVCEAPMDTTYSDTPLSQRAIANSWRRLELREEERRIELQQRSWASFRSIVKKATEEHEQIDRMERMLRSIAERSRSVLNRCFGEVELALMDEEKHERQNIEVQERRARMNHSREAVRHEEVLLAGERLLHDASGTRFLDAMDVAVRQFSSEAVRIAQEEHLERLSLVQAERFECLSLTAPLETQARRSKKDAVEQLAELHSTIEKTTAEGAWRARLALVETEELRVRDGIYNDEAGNRSWWVADERRQRMELTSLETERLRRAKEVARLRDKMGECESVEEQRRIGVQREEASAWATLVREQITDAANAYKKEGQRRIEETRRERYADRSQRCRRALEELLQDEDDDRHYIFEDEREARRRLRRQALQLSCDILEKKKIEENIPSQPVLASQGIEHGPVNDPSAVTVDEERIRQKRLKELAREEELIEAQTRLREAELRIAEEAELRARSEEEKRAALAESVRLLREAEQRAEERIRRARQEAERYVEQEVSRLRDANERQATHAAALRAIEEEEKSAVVEAKLRAAEHALREAERRAADDVRRAKAEAEAFAAAEAQRVALEAKRQLQEYREQQEQQLRQKDLEVQQRLRGIEQQAQEAILAAKAEASRLAEEAKRRLEELEARRVERAAAVDAAKVSVRAAQQRMREFEESRESTPQQPPLAWPVETAASTAEAATAAVIKGPKEEGKDGYTLTAVLCTNVIRAAIRGAVEEVVKATKEAWYLSEEAEHRLRTERRRMRRRQAERDRAEKELINVEKKSILWGEEEEQEEEEEKESKHRVDTGDDKEAFSTPLKQSTRRQYHKKREEKQTVRLQPPADDGCGVCYRKDTVSPCVKCDSQVCLYCGPAAVHSACCEEHHINVINAHRRHLSGEPQKEKQETKEVERENGDDSSLWEVEEVVAVPRKDEVGRSPLGVRRKLLPDDYDEKEEKEDQESEAKEVESPGSVEEPRTVRKRYEAFFVPLSRDAEPRRPKPPTPRNYVPGVFAAKYKHKKAERRCSPPVRRARANKHMSAAAAEEVQQSQRRFPRNGLKEHLAAAHNNQKQQRPEYPRQPFASLNPQFREPPPVRADSRLRRREAERVVMEDPLSAFGRAPSPSHLGVHFPAKTRRPSRSMMGRISPFEASIELAKGFDDFAHRDPTGLERTYYDGKPVRPIKRDYMSDDLADLSNRSSVRRQHQEQYRSRAMEFREEEGHVNVSRERVFVTSYHEVPLYMGTQRNHESLPYNSHQREECNVRTTPTLHELDQRLRHLRQHRLFDRVSQRSPDRHCSRHHFNQEGEIYCGCHNAGSSKIRRPTPCSHDPCITVHLFPDTRIPTAAAGPMKMTRGGSSRRNTSRTDRRSTLRVVSPPWRTELNSGPLRPSWSFEQPHSFITKSYKRTLLPVEP